MFKNILGALILIVALSFMSESFDVLGSLGIILSILGYDIMTKK